MVEASSPWRAAEAVASWRSDTPRALMMHADPLAAFAYRWFGQVASREAIDRGFDWFWRHLRRLDARFDLVVSPSRSLADRLREGGLRQVTTLPLGIVPGEFSPARRDPALRAAAARTLRARPRGDSAGRPRPSRARETLADGGRCLHGRRRRAPGRAGAGRRRARSRARGAPCRRQSACADAGADHRSPGPRPAARQRRRADPRLRGRDLLPGRRRGARGGPAADRTRSWRRVRSGARERRRGLSLGRCRARRRRRSAA